MIVGEKVVKKIKFPKIRKPTNPPPPPPGLPKGLPKS